MKRLVILVTVTALLSGCGVSRIQELNGRAQAALADIEVQLQRRADLVPNLIETVKAYVAIEPETVQSLADARAGLVSALKSGDLGLMEESSAELSRAILELLAAAEQDSALRTDSGFRLIETQLEGTDSEIEIACKDYNDAVAQYNAYIEGFPQAVTAKIIRAGRRDYFRRMEELDASEGS